MSWYDDLLDGQNAAASHIGSHARLLAGPGTGKTLTMTRRVCFLVEEKNVPASEILAVTFTRAATQELRKRIEDELGEDRSPAVSTLHSFALRQLLKNVASTTVLPQPLRLADDWEERHIILEDLKAMLRYQSIEDARERLQALASDWQTLTADEADWEKKHPDSAFLGTWREHRQIYGYTLRSELVYQLKKAMEQGRVLGLQDSIRYLLVDEYQDLNRCDLAVVQAIACRNVELFIAGDDDQSIYGFRDAHPEGIRRFNKDYPSAKNLELEICKRCDRSILEVGLFVARQDPRRIEKHIQPASDAGEGEVKILRFNNQNAEARGIAALCTHLVENCKLNPKDILILLRADRNGNISRPIREKLEEADLPVAVSTGQGSPLDTKAGRSLLAFLQLSVNCEDSLAWRALFYAWCQGVGPKAIGAVYELARSRGQTFAQTVIDAHTDDTILPSRYRSRLSESISKVMMKLRDLLPVDTRGDHETCEALLEVIQPIAENIIVNCEERSAVFLKLEHVAQETAAASIKQLVRAVGVANEEIEQELDENNINILTMHRAKGLTAEAVIVAAAEDEYIPGRACGEKIDDERRLLYVSLTRAKHRLFITYCSRRTGQQSYTGSNHGNSARTLSQFLWDCPHKSQDGPIFISNYGA